MFFFCYTNSRFKCINIFELQIKWKAKKGDETNGGYCHSVLQSILHKVGTYIVIVHLMIQLSIFLLNL
jgi:hypothetical protein